MNETRPGIRAAFRFGTCAVSGDGGGSVFHCGPARDDHDESDDAENARNDAHDASYERYPAENDHQAGSYDVEQHRYEQLVETRTRLQGHGFRFLERIESHEH